MMPSDVDFATLTSLTKAAGCAAKLSTHQLNEMMRGLTSIPSTNLIAGMANFEDAAVYKIAEELALIQTVDFFPPVVDDPYLFGRIAATNALSDIYAMGGRPILCLNIFCFPTGELPLKCGEEILRGGAETIAKAGAVLAGGHSIEGSEPLYGLSATGLIHPDRVLTNGGARANDVLVISKPIGVGVSLLGLKGGVLSESARAELIDCLTRLNDETLRIAMSYPIHAATDITGFGLIGHLHEMASASKLKVRLSADKVPFLSEALSLASLGLVPKAAYGNRRSYESFVSYINDVDSCVVDLCFDPQTSGGLVFALEPRFAEDLVSELRGAGFKACQIAQFSEGDPGSVEVTSNAT